MPAILRKDVDRAYENRILHYARVNQELFFGIDSLGYLNPYKEMVNDLNSRGIKAAVFFQPFTVPNKEFAQELMKHGHSVGLHAVHTKDFAILTYVKTRVRDIGGVLVYVCFRKPDQRTREWMKVYI
jgi:hypothetical protein